MSWTHAWAYGLIARIHYNLVVFSPTILSLENLAYLQCSKVLLLIPESMLLFTVHLETISYLSFT